VYCYYRLDINEYLETKASHGVFIFIQVGQVNDEKKKRKSVIDFVCFGQIKMNMNILMMKKSKVRNFDVILSNYFEFYFQNRNAARNSASLPSMSVIGSAQPDVLRIKVYVSIFNFFF
jgi:hypothetical protein